MGTKVVFSFPRLTTEERMLTTILDGVTVIDKDENKLYLGDGITKGGNEIAKIPSNVTTNEQLESYELDNLKALAYQEKINLEDQVENSLDWGYVGGTKKPQDNANETSIDEDGKLQGVTTGSGTDVSNDLLIPTIEDAQNDITNILQDIDIIDSSLSQNEIDKANLDGKIDATEEQLINSINAEAQQRANAILERVQEEARLDGKIDTKEQELINHANSLSDAQADYTDLVKNALENGITQAEQNAINEAQQKVNTAQTQLEQSITEVSRAVNKAIVISSGVVPAYGSSNYDNISYNDTENAIELFSSSDSSIGIAYPAFDLTDINDQAYKISLSFKSNVNKTSGFYFGICEYDGDLPAGKTHISNSSSNSAAVCVEDTRTRWLGRSNSPITTNWEVSTINYTPSASAKWASVVVLNWSGLGLAKLFIKDFLNQTIPKVNWNQRVQESVDSGEVIVDGSNVYVNSAFVDNLNARGGITADSLIAQTIYGLNIEGGRFTGCVIKASYLDLDGDLEVLTNYHIPYSTYISNPSLYSDAVYIEADNEYRIPSISTVKELNATKQSSSNSWLYSNIRAYDVANAGHNNKAVRELPTITASLNSPVWVFNASFTETHYSDGETSGNSSPISENKTNTFKIYVGNSSSQLVSIKYIPKPVSGSVTGYGASSLEIKYGTTTIYSGLTGSAQANSFSFSVNGVSFELSYPKVHYDTTTNQNGFNTSTTSHYRLDLKVEMKSGDHTVVNSLGDYLLRGNTPTQQSANFINSNYMKFPSSILINNII